VRRLKRKTTVQLTHVLLTASLHSKCVLNQIYSICVIFVNYLSNIFVMWCESSLSDYTIQSTLLTHHYSCADCGQNSGRRVLTILMMIVIRRGRPTHANTALIHDTTWPRAPVMTSTIVLSASFQLTARGAPSGWDASSSARVVLGPTIAPSIKAYRPHHWQAAVTAPESRWSPARILLIHSRPSGLN